MTVIRDRRHEPPNDKFGTDKERFRNRYLDRVRKAIQNDIQEGSFKDIGNGGVKVPIPKESTHEPIFHHIDGNPQERVYPGNKLDVGDRILKPKSGGGRGGSGQEGSPDDADAQDDFIWVSQEEYLKILFEGRSLPDMTKLKSHTTKVMNRQHSGYTDKGPDHRLDADRTDRNRRDESMILAKGAERRIIENLTEQFNILARHDRSIAPIDLSGKTKFERRDIIIKTFQTVAPNDVSPQISDTTESAISVMQKSVEALNTRLRPQVKTLEEIRLNVLETRLKDQFKVRNRAHKLRDEHLVFDYDEDVPKPNAKAVMFCLMDVSASMGQEEKNTAKVFFWLLNKFLKAKYDQVDIVFIAHTTSAKEVDEKTFFYGQDTGGTIVSSCLNKTLEIIKARYPVGDWNIYSAQASDGDNSYDDNAKVESRMNELLPDLQAHYYIEVGKEPGYKSELLNTYETVASQYGSKVYTAGGVKTAAQALDAFNDFFPVGGAKASPAHAPLP